MPNKILIYYHTLSGASILILSQNNQTILLIEKKNGTNKKVLIGSIEKMIF